MTASGWGVDGHRPLGRRAAWAQFSLAIVIGVDLLTIAVGLSERRRLARDPDVTEEELAELADRLAEISVGYTAAFAVAALFFILWLWRAYGNLVPLGAREPRFGRSWAAVGWFVPILNLWRPKQVVNDVWRASDPEAPADQGEAWREQPVPGFVLVWWLLYAFATSVALLLASTLPRETGPEAERALLAFAAADTVNLIAALYAIAVVRATTARQELRAALVARHEVERY